MFAPGQSPLPPLWRAAIRHPERPTKNPPRRTALNQWNVPLYPCIWRIPNVFQPGISSPRTLPWLHCERPKLWPQSPSRCRPRSRTPPEQANKTLKKLQITQSILRASTPLLVPGPARPTARPGSGRPSSRSDSGWGGRSRRRSRSGNKEIKWKSFLFRGDPRSGYDSWLASRR